MKHLYRFIIIVTVSLQGFANVPSQQIKQLLAAPSAVTAKPAPFLTELHKHYQFVVFFRSTCPHCHRFIPVLQDFADYYGIAIHAISVDGPTLDGLHSQKMRAQDYKDYFLQGGFKAIVPALFLENTDTQQVYPVLFGEAAPYQLAERMSALTKHIQEAQDAAH